VIEIKPHRNSWKVFEAPDSGAPAFFWVKPQKRIANAASEENSLCDHRQSASCRPQLFMLRHSVCCRESSMITGSHFFEAIVDLTIRSARVDLLATRQQKFSVDLTGDVC